MSTIKNFSELEELLTSVKPNTMSRHTQSPERMLELMDFLGNPQDSYKVIHVAGTSGKTSTAYYAAALLQAAGKKVGLTISPHVDSINERVQINLVPLPEAEFCAEFAEFLEAIKPSGIVPTYFEAFTAFAFWEFARRRVEYAVVEVGVGGLADSTNVIHRPDKVCAIGDIGYGHTLILGNTLPEIAAQKAGIIQLNNTVFCHTQSEEIMRAIRDRARQKHADLHELDHVAAFSFLPLFQRRNFALSEAAVHFVLQRDGATPLSKDAIAKAARLHIAARMEMFERGGKTIILDGAHNTQKMQGLVRSLHAQFPGKSVAVLFALLPPGPKFTVRMVQELAPLKPYVIVTGFPPDACGHYGSSDPQKVFAAVQREFGPDAGEVVETPEEAFAVLQKRPEDLLVVTGTFFLLNYIRPLL